jgi:thiamine-phosphate pyrophosphorylase
MIDANLNRACEAARTLEDLARFVLDDKARAARLKLLRKTVVEAVAAGGYGPDRLAAARDTARDVGVALSAGDEHRRGSPAGLAAAAGSRLGEALRVLEESLKLSSPGAAARVESQRYAAYDAAAGVILGLSRVRPAWRVCVLITESLCEHHGWLEVARGAVQGGADALQLREKSLPDRELLSRARALVRLAESRGVAVMVNDRADIARLSGAAGVHVGQDDLPVAEARSMLPPGQLIGVSCSTLDEALAAAQAGADVLGLGSMYSSGTKPKPEVSGVSLLSSVLNDPRLSGVPHLAIGGIDASRAASLAAVGCRGVAVSSAVCSSNDPAAATAEILAAMSATPVSTTPVSAPSGAAHARAL